MRRKNNTSNQKGVLFIDYLQFMVNSTQLINQTESDEIPLFLNNEKEFDFLLVKQKFSGPVFNSRFLVYYGDSPVADLLTHPKHPSINPEHLISVKMHNHLLYSSDLWHITDQLINDLHGEVNNVSRLDISCDYQGDALQVCNEWVKDNIGLKGGKVLKVEPIMSANHQVQTMYVGARGSQKSLCIYNKTKELQKSNKLYIAKSWAKNGLKDKTEENELKEVTRIELRVKNDLLKSYGVSFQKLRNKSIIKSLYCESITSLIRFYKKDPNRAKARTNTLEKLSILPKNLLYFKPLERSKKLEGKITWRKKVHVKSTIEEFFNNDFDFKLFQHAYQLADDYGLDEWFFKKIELWLKFFGTLKQRELERPVPDIEDLLQELNKRTHLEALTMVNKHKQTIVSRVYEWQKKGGALKQYNVDVFQMVKVFNESDQTEIFLNELD